jgi:hypothetical protein
MATINDLPNELVQLILVVLSDVDKLALLMTQTRFYNLFCEIKIRQKVYIGKVIKHEYPMCFTSLSIYNIADMNLLTKFTSMNSLSLTHYFDAPRDSNVSSLRIKKIYRQHLPNEMLNDVRYLTTDTTNDHVYSLENCIPTGIVHLTLELFFYKASLLNCIPLSVTHLVLELYLFNQSLLHCIPHGVTHLSLTMYCDHSIKHWIPNTVTHLIFNISMSESLHGCIPNSVTDLTFGNNFYGYIIGCIPNGVTHLNLGDTFNRRIRGALPNGLTHLTFGEKFNQCIINAIPHTVTHLTFGKDFNQRITSDMIPNVIQLTMHYSYRHSLPITNYPIKFDVSIR